MSTESNCPNCNAELKNKLFSYNQLVSAQTVAVINFANEDNKAGYCQKCCGDMLASVTVVKKKIQAIKDELAYCLHNIPVLNLQAPQGWDYMPFHIVTAQSVTGTGIISEFSQSISDLFGSQSENLNSKLRSGEEHCFAQLRKKALDMGANAVIAVDIDYAELGSGRGMIMVCCTGTAVYLNNIDILGDSVRELIEKIPALTEQLKKTSAILSEYGQLVAV